MKLLLRRRTARRSIQLAQYAFAVAGLLALGYCLTVFLEARFYQAREARKFASERRADVTAAPETPAASATAEAPPASPGPRATMVAPANGSVVGRLEIPRIGISVMVVEGVETRDLKRAAGHIPGTALPGEPGNVGIAAHRDTFFRPLRAIKPDDMIRLDTLDGSYRYRVVSTKVVLPADVQVLYPTGHDTLTLVTCFPFDYVGSAPKRFIVRADRLRSPS